MNTLNSLRQFRLLDYAVFDFVASFAAVLILAPALTKLFAKLGWEITLRNWLLLTVPLSVLVHKIFGIETPLTFQFFHLNDYYIVKIVVLLLLIGGLYGIKRN